MAKYVNQCEICKTTISKNAKRCPKHAAMLAGRITNKLPSDQEIMKMVERTSIAKTAKTPLGVNVTTIKNIVLKYR